MLTAPHGKRYKTFRCEENQSQFLEWRAGTAGAAAVGAARTVRLRDRQGDRGGDQTDLFLRRGLHLSVFASPGTGEAGAVPSPRSRRPQPQLLSADPAWREATRGSVRGMEPGSDRSFAADGDSTCITR